MEQITLQIGGRRYELTVRKGQEEHFQRLAGIVDEKARTVAGAMTGVNEARQLLMTALLLADEIGGRPVETAPAQPAPPSMPPDITHAIEALADRLERLAERFEHSAS